MRALLLLLLITLPALAADVTVQWDAPTTYEDGTPLDSPVRYWVKRDGSPVGTVTAESFSETLPPGAYCYTLQAVVSKGGEDFPSASTLPVCTTVEQPGPEAPSNVTITVTVQIQ